MTHSQTHTYSKWFKSDNLSTFTKSVHDTLRGQLRQDPAIQTNSLNVPKGLMIIFQNKTVKYRHRHLSVL